VPSTLTVTNNLDSGAGSLRADVAAARSGDTIVFDPSLNGQTITLTSGELLINKNLTITGPGASQLTISGDNASRVFEVAAGTHHQPGQLSLSGLTISNGDGVFAAGSSHTNDGDGGAILNNGTLTISNSILSGNSAGNADFGGAIENNGTLTVDGCTLTGNSAGQYSAGMNGYGGAIANFGTLTVSASLLSASLLSNNSAAIGGGIFNVGTATVNSGTTLSGNSATAYGGGYMAGNTGTVTVKNHSSITGNTAPAGSGPDVYNLGTLYLDITSIIGILNGNPVMPIWSD
jgi:hypothetical protein